MYILALNSNSSADGQGWAATDKDGISDERFACMSLEQTLILWRVTRIDGVCALFEAQVYKLLVSKELIGADLIAKIEPSRRSTLWS